MKPPLFKYWAPRTVDEALDGLWQLVENQGLAVKLLAGGQSLMPVLNMRLSSPDVIVDLNGLSAELSYVRANGSTIRIGALMRHHQLETDPIIAAGAPIVREAERHIGHVAIRSRGTIGGSLVHADPSAELPLMLTLLQGAVALQSRTGRRVVSASDFFVTYLTTAVKSTEILTEIQIPVMPRRTGQRLEEFSLRQGDFAIVAAAAQVSLNEDGKISDVRLALGGVAPVPMDVSPLLVSLVGTTPGEEQLAESAEPIREHIDPEGDIHADAAYRKELAVVLSCRALSQALSRARLTSSLSG